MVSALLLLLPCSIKADEPDNKLQGYLNADIVSHYMWRGQDLANVSIQPEVGITWKGLTFNLQGTTCYSSDQYEEVDINLFYEYKGFNIGLSDYWCENGINPRYFTFGKYSNHLDEVHLGYDFGFASLTWNTMIAGNDYKTNGKRAYSSFVELAVPISAFGLDWDFNVGLCPYESAGYMYEETVTDETGTHTGYGIDYYYAKSFGICMLSVRGTKTLEFKQFNLPIFAEFHTNPASGNARLLFGISLDIK